MEPSLDLVWNAAGRRIGAAAGAGLALVSLVNGLPLHAAALRGGLLLLVVLAVTHASGLVLRRLDQGRRVELPGRTRT